jgi:endo-1,4-beta-D-glucanase Y
MMSAFLRLMSLVTLPLAIAVTACAADNDWETFRKAFVEADGRVVDTGQARISHSEGQGYAMLLAVHHDDRASFERMWQWTRKHLMVRDDGLLAWRWDPQKGVTDKNNAADGDILVAWALARAGEKWRHADYTAAAQKLAQETRRKSLRKVAHGLVIVPGQEGFDKPEGLTINLSYWVFPAFRDLARVDPAPEWEELARSGVAILRYSYFGRWRLPPDWLRLSDPVAPGGTGPERFGYDAVRIPLYLAWARRDDEALLKPYRDFWAHFERNGTQPSWTNLKDDSVDTHGAPAGMKAVAFVVREGAQARADRLPALEAGESYYSAVLLLLTKMALRERPAV